MRALICLVAILSGAMAMAQTPPVPDAQAGTLYPFLQSQVPAQFPLSFLSPRFTDVEQWQRQARKKVRELLHYNPPKCAPRPEVIERVDCGDYVREKIAFNTTPDIRVPAYVLIPKDGVLPPTPSRRSQASAQGGGTKRHPAVLLLHDHGAFFAWGKEKVIGLPNEHPALTAFKQMGYSGRSVGNELVKRGYVVMAIDMMYWGERRMILPGDPPEYQDREKMTPEQVAAFNRRAGELLPRTAIGVFESGTTWAGIMFTDDMRSVDYLASRPDVDPDRIGCCGLSVGGFRSAHLCGLDPRIKAAVVVGWMCSYPAMLQQKLTSIGFWAVVPGLQQFMDLPDVVSMHAPQPLMCIQGTQDGLFTNEGVQAAYDRIAAVYAKAGAKGRFQPVTYDGPHEFNAEMQDKAFAWLDRWLK